MQRRNKYPYKKGEKLAELDALVIPEPKNKPFRFSSKPRKKPSFKDCGPNVRKVFRVLDTTFMGTGSLQNLFFFRYGPQIGGGWRVHFNGAKKCIEIWYKGTFQIAVAGDYIVTGEGYCKVFKGQNCKWKHPADENAEA